jgi:hypothetical protein
MADSGALGGLTPAGDRYGGAPHHDRGRGAPQRPEPPRTGDSVLLRSGVDAALALLRERVLAATRRLVPGMPQAGTIFGSGYGASTASADAAGAEAAVAAIENEQRWIAACRPELDAAALRCAFDEGLDDTEAILREVAAVSDEVAPWLLAVRRAHAARGGA